MPKNPPPYEAPLCDFEALREKLMKKIIVLRGEVKELHEYRKLLRLSELHLLLDRASDIEELLHAWTGVHRVARDIRSKSIL